MTTDPGEPRQPSTADERKAAVEEARLQFEQSFAKKWFPTLVTLTVAFVAGVFGFVQQITTAAATDRATIEARSRSELEWGFKAIELYVTKQELFDINKDPERASRNLQALIAVAPEVVKGVLSAEISRIPPPRGGGPEDESRINALAGAAVVQSALGEPATTTFSIYLQFPEGARANAEKIKAMLQGQGYKVPSTEQVRNVPNLLEVRYYRPEQRILAESLAQKIVTTLGRPPDSGRARMLTTTKQLPSGIMEVWLSR